MRVGCFGSLWIIGRPGAGKTTAATLLRDALAKSGYRAGLVDGNRARRALGKYGHSAEDRLALIRKYVDLNLILQGRGVIPVTATMCGLRAQREIVRDKLVGVKFFFLDCPFAVAAGRKPHLYRKAMAGKLGGFYGVDIAFEPPAECEMTIDSAILTPHEIVDRIMARLCISEDWDG
jgi:adenylylsulfate kinase-like enzyme